MGGGRTEIYECRSRMSGDAHPIMVATRTFLVGGRRRQSALHPYLGIEAMHRFVFSVFGPAGIGTVLCLRFVGGGGTPPAKGVQTPSGDRRAKFCARRPLSPRTAGGPRHRWRPRPRLRLTNASVARGPSQRVAGLPAGHLLLSARAPAATAASGARPNASASATTLFTSAGATTC